jgi:hypothetical protein
MVKEKEMKSCDGMVMACRDIGRSALSLLLLMTVVSSTATKGWLARLPRPVPRSLGVTPTSVSYFQETNAKISCPRTPRNCSYMHAGCIQHHTLPRK